MNANYAKLDNVRGELTITIEEKDYADKVKKQLKEIHKNHAEPGFRPGKVPMGLIEKKYGKAVKYDAINKEVGDQVFNYIKENNLHVLGNPVPEKNDSFNIEDKDFTFTFKLGLAPEIDTHVNKDLHVPFYNITVTDEMIDRQDDQFRRRFGKQEPGEEVDETALVKGVITELNEDGTVKEGGIVVENGIVAPQYFKDAEQAKLFIGKKVGDEVVFNPAATCAASETEMSSMLNIPKEDVENHKGDFRFDIKEIIVLKLAEHDEEFFKMVFGPDKVHNEEEYREALKQLIADSLKADSNYRFSIDAQDSIMKAVGSLELPDEILKEFLKMQNEHLTDENIDEEYTRMRPELEWELVKETILAQFDVKVEQEDLLNMARLVARNQFAQYGMTSVPEETLDKYANDILKDEKAGRQIAAQATDVKLFNAIKDAVSVDEKDVNVEEFNDLFRQNAEAAEA